MVDVNDDAKGGGYRRVEVLTGPGRRRKWSDDDKARIVAETLEPGAVVAEVARRWQVCPQQVFGWRREMRRGAGSALSFVPIVAEPAVRRAGADAPAPLIEVKLAGAVLRDPARHRRGPADDGAARDPGLGGMITLPAGARILLATEPVDFRKGAHAPGGAGGRGAGRRSVLGRGAGVPLEACRPGQDPGLGWQRPGAGLEAAGGRRVPLAAGGGRRGAADARWSSPRCSTGSIGDACRRREGFPSRACLRRIGGTMRAADADTPSTAGGSRGTAGAAAGGAGRERRHADRRARRAGGAERASAPPAAEAAAPAVRPEVGAAARGPVAVRLRGDRGDAGRERGRGGQASRRRCASSRRSAAAPAAAVCPRTCRASSRCCAPERDHLPLLPVARWWRSAPIPPSGST